MIKTLFIFIIFLFIVAPAAMCQLTKSDSVKIKANKDASHFKLDDVTWKKYKHTLPQTSDYFKPTSVSTANDNLLKDSDYVTAYRTAAYYKNKGRHTAVIFGADLATVIIVAVIIAGAIYAGPKIGN